jgi:hypothetical protein
VIVDVHDGAVSAASAASADGSGASLLVELPRRG